MKGVIFHYLRYTIVIITYRVRVNGLHFYVQASESLGRHIGHFIDEGVVEDSVFGRRHHSRALPN